MKVLLTGGAGYVGSACLRWLCKHGHDPVAYDNLAEGNRQAVPEGRLIEGDILDLDRLTQAIKDTGAEAVMHFAALASVPDSIRVPEEYWRTNAVGTKNVLDAMRANGVNKILFSGTAATYSFEVEMPIAETSSQVPQTPYGTTKLAAEHLIKDYSRAYGMGYGILRYFNASGADPDGEFGEDRRKETHLIPLVLFAALGRIDKFKICGSDWPTPDGSCVRDFVHTDDLAQAHQLVLESVQPGSGQAYNVGSGTGASVIEVFEACEKVVGRSIPCDRVEARPGDPAVLVADTQKLREKLGWKPKYDSVEDIVQTAWQWHNRYPQGYKSKHQG
ncbi:UDP-glucose 4-epimerase GalE [Planctomycetales bacterium ZRK34]|nr:UDP-glucose 4-epimerase GalE [Planctomycetales bacterium ZRK34]